MYKYNIVGDGGNVSITIISSEGETRTLNSAHPNFHKVLNALNEGFEDEVYEYDDDNIWYNDDELEERWLLEQAGNALVPATNALTAITERITFDGKDIFWDGDRVDNALSRHLMRTIRNGEKVDPVANFMENLGDNPSAVSRRRLWRWMQDRDFTLTDDGMIVGYKGVQATEDNLSCTAGKETVFVNGVEHKGHIPNPAGAVVHMARGLVDPDINNTCSVGLHVGNYRYAKSFGARVLTVLVNPRDVVEVPTDSNGEKIRTCRYVVQSVETEEEISDPVLHVAEPRLGRGSDTWDDEPEDLREV